MADLGVRLQLFIGPTIPVPAPYPVVDALDSLEVTNRDHQRDGFQMTFSLGKDSLLDYGLLSSGLLDPPGRVIVMVLINALPQVLIDGMITNHQVQPRNQAGQSRLAITGEDISLQMDLEEKSATYPNQPDFGIVTQIVASYGLLPDVTTTTKVPVETEQIPTQQDTDLRYVQKLARNNGFVFFVEPTDIPMINRAYWGPDHRQGMAQTPLNTNMGSATNVERKTIARDTAGLSLADAQLKMLELLTQSSDSVDARGELDALQYGRALRARQLVTVRGAGQSYDGSYYVKQVTHNIRRGEYRQTFGLTREGQGALSLKVGQ